jgi:hypothetical protein
MSETPGGSILRAVEQSLPAVAMRGELWLYPAVETVHLWGIAVLVGAVILFDLRLLGFARAIPLRALARHLLRWAVSALLLIVPSGLLMFSAHAGDFIDNRAFVLKMVLLMLAATNAAALHAGVLRSAAAWDVAVAAPLAARLHAVTSIVLWLCIVGCGRLIAYV